MKTFEIVIKHSVESTFSVFADTEEEALTLLKEAITREIGTKVFDDFDTVVLSIKETAQAAFTFEEPETVH